MVIGIDFDGTCVTHEFPNVGAEIGALPVLRELVAAGHQLILFTMRSNRALPSPTGDEGIQDVTGWFLDDAIGWFKAHNIPLWGVQTNPTQKSWTTSPKAYCHLYIDDAALGCPLTLVNGKPCVDWARARYMLKDLNLL